MIALNKHTGQLVARDDEQIGEQLWRGQWSSPSLATVNGKPQVLFATGNGLCYGFEPVDPATKVAPDRWITTMLARPDRILHRCQRQRHSRTFPRTIREQVQSPRPRAQAGAAAGIPLFDQPAGDHADRFHSNGCRAGRADPEEDLVVRLPCAGIQKRPVLRATECKGDGQKHPCDIISTPVFYRNRVYVAIGGDPDHGSKNSRGNLALHRSDRRPATSPRNGKVWNYDQMNAAMTTVSIADGLVFVIDEASVIHCLDADTGQKYWTYEVKTDRGLLNSALLAADGKVFVGRTILAVSKKLKVLGSHRGKHRQQLLRAVRRPTAFCIRCRADGCGRCATRAEKAAANGRKVHAGYKPRPRALVQ